MSNTNPAIGRYWPQDEAGYLINDTHLDKVPIPVKNIAEELITFLKANFPDSIKAFYLRGSAAWGGYIPNISDIDFFIITNLPDYRWETPPQVQSFLATLIHQYNIEIECPFATCIPAHADWLENRPYLSAHIKCCSLLLAGEDFAKQISKIKPGKYLCPNLRWYSQDWAEFKEGEETIQDIRDMAKLSLRCAFQMVMERKGKYTNSLGYCLNGFLEYYPEWKEAGEKALNAFLEPKGFEKNKVLLNKFWEWLAREIDLKEATRKV